MEVREVENGLEGKEQNGSSETRRFQIHVRVWTPTETLSVVDDDTAVTAAITLSPWQQLSPSNVDRDQATGAA